MKCEKCNRDFLSKQGLIYHLIRFKEINKKCYQFYIDKYQKESDFPWKLKKIESKICEYCNKKFKRNFALQTHLMTSKKYNSKCYQFYINKYKKESEFPTKLYSSE